MLPQPVSEKGISCETIRDSQDTILRPLSFALLPDGVPIDIHINFSCRYISGIFHSVAANLVWTTSESGANRGQIHPFSCSSICHLFLVLVRK